MQMAARLCQLLPRSEIQTDCRLLEGVDKTAYFQELRLRADTEAGLDKLLSCITSAVTGIVQVLDLQRFCSQLPCFRISVLCKHVTA